MMGLPPVDFVVGFILLVSWGLIISLGVYIHRANKDELTYKRISLREWEGMKAEKEKLERQVKELTNGGIDK